jgi:exportin-7
MATILNMVIFSNPTNQWSLARPLISLILTNQRSFSNYAQTLASTQPPETHARLKAAFDNLMNGVQAKLDTANREKFTTNLIQFKQELSSFCIRPPDA